MTDDPPHLASTQPLDLPVRRVRKVDPAKLPLQLEMLGGVAAVNMMNGAPHLFTTENLRAAGKAFPFHSPGSADYYRSCLIDTLNLPPSARVRYAVRFLRGWKAIPWGKGGLTDPEVSAIIEGFINENLSVLMRLDQHSLGDPEAKKLEFIGSLFVDLLTRGNGERQLKATAAGKLLHFFLPKRVLLWDLIYVRRPLLLDEMFWESRDEVENERKRFLALQRMGWRLTRHLISTEGQKAIDDVLKEHEQIAGCPEPLPKLIDELFYDRRGNRERAIAQLGGLDCAFSEHGDDD